MESHVTSSSSTGVKNEKTKLSKKLRSGQRKLSVSPENCNYDADDFTLHSGDDSLGYDDRKDRKLFHTSTTEIFEPSLYRTSSFLSGSTGSRRCSQSSLSSSSYHLGSSTRTVSSTSSGSSNAVYQTMSGKKTGLTEHSIRDSAISSLSWDFQHASSHPDARTGGAQPVDRTSSISDTSETSDLISFDGRKLKNRFREVLPREQTSRPQVERPSTSFAAVAMIHASCPTLNTTVTGQIKRRDLQNRGLAAVSTVDIGNSNNAVNVLPTSRSCGCIYLLQLRSLQSRLKRPITLRFAPSGLTESNRVVWISDSGNHSGVVRWVGKIRDKYYAGVEFEKQIGNSSGIYGYGYGLQIRLFTCKLGYGRFIPIDELILFEDFYENQKTGFICIICRDDFVEPGQTEDFQNPEKLMVATKCGHLFHQSCLNQWFNEKPAAFQHCPYCQFPMERNDTIRIFPAQPK